MHIDSLIQALRELGAEVSLAAPEPPKNGPGTPARASWLNRMRRRMPRWLHELAELAFNIPEALALLRAVRAIRPDLIYQRSNVFLLSGLWVARWTGLPLISEVNAPYFRERSQHGGITLCWLAESTERALWRGADAVITVTGVLASIVQAAQVPADRVYVMPNGIDTRMFGSHAIDTTAKARLGLENWIVLGFTGFVREWNGLEAVIDLLATRLAQGCFLLVVGDGPARARLESQARKQGVADRVRFTGVIARNDVAAHVAAFDVALQPAANTYASPLKLFEYMALRRAIVAPDQPNIREILTDGRDALLFDPARPGAFPETIGRLITDQALRAHLAEGAGRTVRERDLTWRRNAQRVLDLSNKLLRSSASARQAQDRQAS